MKQFRFIAMTLFMVLTMGITLSSCLEDDDKQNYVTQLIFASLDSSGQLHDANGVLLAPTNAVYLSGLTPGLYQMIVQYDPTVQLSATKSLSVTLQATPSKIENNNVTDIGSAPAETSTLYALSAENVISPLLFDGKYLILPVLYWAKNVATNSQMEAEAKNHNFVLAYQEPADGDTILRLRLIDNMTNPERGDTDTWTYVGIYQAFNIEAVIAQFKTKGTLKEIRVSAKVNMSSNDLNSNFTSEGSYTIYIQ